MSKRGLGRGFESLIPTEMFDEEFDLTATEDEKVSSLREIDLKKIVRDEEQPRKDFGGEALADLAKSIKEHGVLQPIVVTKEGEKYRIVAGERRFRAAKIAGLEKIPAIVRTLDAQKRLELSIIENAQREDLNAIELATAYTKLKSQFNLSAKDIAERVGKSESAVTNTMRLLNLPSFAKTAMVKEKISEGVMRPLISADEELVKKILPKIIEEGWTARKVERYVAENKKQSSVVRVKKDRYIKEEEAISQKLGAKVRVRGRSVTINCKTEDDLKKILDFLNK